MYFSLTFPNIDFATNKSLDVLSNPHVTLAFRPTEDQKAQLIPYLNKEFEVKVIGYANDGKNEGYQVLLPSELPYFNKATPHITISTSKDSKPVKTGFLEFAPIKETFTLKGIVTLVEW